MTWRAIQIGVLVVGLALLFAGTMGVVSGRWVIVILAAVGVLALVAVQLFVVRRQRRRNSTRP